MSLGKLFIKVLLTKIITKEELVWIASNQISFSRCEEAAALRLGRLVDSGNISIETTRRINDK